MLVISAIFGAVLAVAVLWFLVLRWLSWLRVRNTAVLLASAVFVALGTVHFVYLGLSLAVLGLVVARWHPKGANRAGGI